MYDLCLQSEGFLCKITSTVYFAIFISHNSKRSLSSSPIKNQNVSAKSITMQLCILLRKLHVILDTRCRSKVVFVEFSDWIFRSFQNVK